MTNNNTKVKGLLKGLRYISQIFENEKESEMKIGLPTDVKHVAHIGWDGDGPSVNSAAPTWMTEFKGPAGGSPDNLEGGEGSSRKGSRVPNSPARDLPGLPKSSRQQQQHSSTNGESCSPTKQKSDKPKQRRSSKQSSMKNKDSSDGGGGGAKPRRSSKDQSGQGDGESSAAAKKNRRKKSKDVEPGGSLRSARRSQSSETDHISDTISEPG